MSMRYPGGLIASTPVTANYPSGVWTQAQAAPYQSQNVWTRDQFWPNTTLLLQGDGAVNGAQNNTFLDSSSNNFTITRNGNTTQGSFTPYEQDGYWSNYFDGSGDYLSVADNTALTLTGDHTIEAFVYLTAYSANYSTVVARWQASGTQEEFLLWIGSTGTVEFYFRPFGAGTPLLSGGTVNRNSWTHIAVVRSGNDWALFVGGSRVATATNSGVYTDTTATLTIGSLRSTYTQYDLTGYISNVRLVKGTAVYAQSSTTLTVPTAPLTAITNTSLLTCQSNRFKDNSTNNFTVTPNGDISVQAFQPFPGATTWSASVLGGSGYFDGSGDFLNYTDSSQLNFGTGSYTIEFWIYGPSNNDNFILGNNNTSTIQVTTGGSASTVGALRYVAGGNVTTSGSVLITDNAWHHCAIVRNGSSNVTLYIDGVSVGTGTDSTNYTSTTSTVTIAKHNSLSSNYLTGYLSNLRIVKGTAVYTSAFTPPAAPLTAISGTSLLLNFTNAGIYDNSMMNNLETVGNAQVSTSVVKYGTGSMAFDGTGDWLTMPNSKGLYIGSGDFTIEGWLYLNALGSVRAIVSQFNSGGTGPGWTLYTKTTNVLEFYGGSGTVTVTGTTAIAAVTWTHFAVVRSGSTITIYVNGVAGGTATNSSFSDDTTALGYVGGRADSSGLALNGYIDDLRITKGAARYITNFTPPIARLPAQ